MFAVLLRHMRFSSITFLVLFTTLTISAGAQFSAVTYTSSSSFNGDIRAQAIAPDGSVYVVGKHRIGNPQMNDVIYVSKFDTMGVPIWTQEVFDATYDRYPSSIAVDNNSIYICGSASGLYPNTDHYSYLIRLDNNGVFEWQRNFDTLAEVHDLAIFPDGGCVASGKLFHQLMPDSAIVLRIDSSGNSIFVHEYGGISYNDLCVDASGNVYTCGVSSLITGDVVATLTKLDSGGNLIWSKYYQDFSTSLSFQYCDVVGNVIWLAGYSSVGSFPQMPTMTISKMDSGGNCYGFKTIGDSSHFYRPGRIHATPYNSLIVVGYAGTLSNHHSFILELDWNLDFVRGIQNSQWHTITGICQSANGNINLGGWSSAGMYYVSHRAIMDQSWNIGCGFYSLADSTVNHVVVTNSSNLTYGSLAFQNGSSVVNNVSITYTSCINQVGIGHFNTSDKPNLFPNPSSEFCVIQFPFLLNEAQNIYISDANGAIVLSTMVAAGSQNTKLDVSGLPCGMYFVNAQGTFLGKLVVQR